MPVSVHDGVVLSVGVVVLDGVCVVVYVGRHVVVQVSVYVGVYVGVLLGEADFVEDDVLVAV